MALGISRKANVSRRKKALLRQLPSASIAPERPAENAVIAATYCVTAPTPNAPPSAFRQTKRYTSPVGSCEAAPESVSNRA